MPRHCDVLIVGGGLLGCFVARGLARLNIGVALVEKNPDLCMGVSRANTAIVYPGHDQKPGSLKARLTVRACRAFETLCQELDVPYNRCGLLVAAFGPVGMRRLEEKLRQGRQNGVEGLRLLAAGQVLETEPAVAPGVLGGLYAPGAGTVNPWELCLAAAENAHAGGVEFYLDTGVMGARQTEDGFCVETTRGVFCCRALVNCAGLWADEINDMVAPPGFRIVPSKGEYLVLDEGTAGFVRHIVTQEPEHKDKGGTLVPTVDGNLLLGPSREAAGGKTDAATTAGGLAFVRETARALCPGVPLGQCIRAFSALRPELELVTQTAGGRLVPTGERVHDFYIFSPKTAPGLVNLAGIKTPGLTCADEIGRYVSGLVAARLGNPGPNPSFSPLREGPVRFARCSPEEKRGLVQSDPRYGHVVCRCRQVSEAEILDAIRRPLGARTLGGVKRRTGAMTGRCQGGYCTHEALKILAAELKRQGREIDYSSLITS